MRRDVMTLTYGDRQARMDVAKEMAIQAGIGVTVDIGVGLIGKAAPIVWRGVEAIGDASMRYLLWGAEKVVPDVGVVGGESVTKTVRFNELASGASKAEVRALLENSEQLGLTQLQVQKVKDLLGSARMDGITIKKMESGDLRFAGERPGRTSGYQRMSFEINLQGQTTKVIQTAFDDANILVRQRPGEIKNNLYDVKKWTR